MFAPPHLVQPPPPPPEPAPPQGVARRNERERKRVRLVNLGFARLRQFVPGGRPGKRLSKVETLRAAIQYIRHLRQMLGDAPQHHFPTTPQHRTMPRFYGYAEEVVYEAPVSLEGPHCPWAPYVWGPVASDAAANAGAFEGGHEVAPPRCRDCIF